MPIASWHPGEGLPRVVVSRCLGFGRCRWNGVELDSSVVDSYRDKVVFIPVCPECEIGLGVPRPPIRIVELAGRTTLVQPDTGRDLSRLMDDFSRRFLSRLPLPSGFLLKSRSPSCGLSDTPVFPASEAAEPLPRKNGPGFFARAVLRNFSALPMIDERRLRDPVAAREWLRALGTG